MRRGYFLMLVLFAICAIEGCRRGGGVVRPPVKVVKEDDFMINKAKENMVKVQNRKNVLIDQSRKNGRWYQFKDEDFDPDAEIRFEDVAPGEQGKLEAEELKKAWEAERDVREEKSRIKILGELGELYLEFANAKEIKDRSVQNFGQHVRRSGRLDLRKLIVDDKAIIPVMEVDLTLPTGQLLLYYGNAFKEVHHYADTKKGKLNVATSKKEDLERRVNEQRLRMALNAYKDFLADGAGNDYDALKNYFRKNALPAIYESHVKGEIKLLDPARLPKTEKEKKLPPPYLAIFKEEIKEKGHLGIGLKKDNKDIIVGYEPAPGDRYK